MQGSAALEKGWGIIPQFSRKQLEAFELRSDRIWVHFRKASSGCWVGKQAGHLRSKRVEGANGNWISGFM